MAMLQRPNAVGLTLCRLVLVEEHTRNVTLVSAFQRLEFDLFPATAEPFSVYTVLTDGLGDIALNLVVSRCDTLDEIYVRSLQVNVKNPRSQLRLWWRVRSCVFPVPGDYEFNLKTDGESITQNVLHVLQTGDSHA
ncbi:MAG: hypothetical protein L0Y72_01820 [Gemmataceae bacterium]|nr:hypothetical protein [Gemmataceae bacterium]MCI0737753.1 hypothetical protein [Gemmataceae bacterium]